MRRAVQAAIPDTLLDAIKIAVASAVTKAHEQAQRERPYWFRHILMRCEVKADKNYAPGALAAGIQLATAKQTIDLGPIIVLDLGQGQ